MWTKAVSAGQRLRLTSLVSGSSAEQGPLKGPSIQLQADGVH